MKRVESILGEEDAITAIEYALLSSLIAVVILTSVVTVGNEALALLQRVSDCVVSAVSNNGNCS